MISGKLTSDQTRSSTDSDRAPSLHNFESSTLLDDSPGTAETPSTLVTPTEQVEDEQTVKIRKLIRRMRLQIWAGTISGFIVALAIGAAFIAVVSFFSCII